MPRARPPLPLQRRRGVPGFVALLWFTAVFAAAAAQPSGFTVNPASREAARIFYRTVYVASENVETSWTGDVATNNAGTTSALFKQAVQHRINWFRAMAGVPAGITIDGAFSA